jgi:hypothetical protein
VILRLTNSCLKFDISSYLRDTASYESRPVITYTGEAPVLSIAPKPDTAKQWQVRQQVLTEMQNEVDTFELVEAGDVQRDQYDPVSGADDEWNY